MSYLCRKSVRLFGKDFAAGDTIPEEYVLKSRARRLAGMGFIVEIADPQPDGQKQDDPQPDAPQQVDPEKTPEHSDEPENAQIAQKAEEKVAVDKKSMEGGNKAPRGNIKATKGTKKTK